LWGSAAFAFVALGLIVGLLWWRASDGGPRPADEARLAGVLSEAPTAPATFTAAPAASATRPPNSPFPPTATPLPAMIDYAVQSGDTMYAIAFKYNVTLDDILAANEDTLQDVNSLSLGQVLRIPLRGEGEVSTVGDAVESGDAETDGAEGAPDAQVDTGAQAQEASGADEDDASGNADTDAPEAPEESPAVDGEPIVVQEALTYVVDRGDTLGRIAAEYGVPVDDLVRNNDLSGPNALLSIGQSIVVAPAVVETTTPAPTAISTPMIYAAADDPRAAAVLPREDAIGPALMPAPLLLAPGNGARTGALAITLRWASVGALPANAYYVVALRLPDEPESETRYVWLRGGGNGLRVPATLRPAMGAEQIIEWAVSVRRERGGLLGEEVGVLVSEAPVWRRFTWAPGADESPENPPATDAVPDVEGEQDVTPSPAMP
jgi:LysM repeat protein